MTAYGLRGLQKRKGQGLEQALGLQTPPIPRERLTAAVAEAYERCGFERDGGLGPLNMLSSIEARMEQYIAFCSTCVPRGYSVEAMEHACEKLRRQVTRGLDSKPLVVITIIRTTTLFFPFLSTVCSGEKSKNMRNVVIMTIFIFIPF